MKLVYSKDSIKSLKKLPQNKQKKIAIKLSFLKNNLQAGKALKGEFKGLFSLKVWPYRVIYELNDKQGWIIIHKIEHRQ
ncbi:type II toxin-antitoxin system mRNA interferase toxin, RelE/StbE family, partial [Candidatus Beckwithbacteria bacterium CG23_combo_of_CG06-09_8_20_14_all_47_9]